MINKWPSAISYRTTIWCSDENVTRWECTKNHWTFHSATYLMVSSPVLYLDIDANVSGSTILSVQLCREELESVSPISEDCIEKKRIIHIVMDCDLYLFYLTVTTYKYLLTAIFFKFCITWRLLNASDYSICYKMKQKLKFYNNQIICSHFLCIL